MKKLDDKTIVRIMKEEWQHRCNNVINEIEAYIDVDEKDGKKDNVLSPGLKVRKMNEPGKGLLFTIVALSKESIVLKEPEGRKFVVSYDEFEKDYDIKKADKDKE
jgi:hypothetical protein